MDDIEDELFAGRLRRCRHELFQAQEAMGEIAQIIGKELAIGTGQCTRLVNCLRASEVPVQMLLSRWSAPEQLPLPVRSTRHALLVLLQHATKTAADLITQISQLSEFYRTCSVQQAHWYRQQLLTQLDGLQHCHQQILDQLDHLIFADAEGMKQP